MGKIHYSEACAMPTKDLIQKMGCTRYKELIRSLLDFLFRDTASTIIGVYGNRAGGLTAKRFTVGKETVEYYVSMEDYQDLKYRDSYNNTYSVFDGVDEAILRNFALAQYIGV